MLPPPPCCRQGLFLPLPGPFRLIPVQGLAQCSPISWTFFSHASSGHGLHCLKVSPALSLPTPGPGGQSRWYRAQALESHRFGFESQFPHWFNSLSLAFSSVTQGSKWLSHDVVKIIEEGHPNSYLLLRVDMYQVPGSSHPLRKPTRYVSCLAQCLAHSRFSTCIVPTP